VDTSSSWGVRGSGWETDEEFTGFWKWTVKREVKTEVGSLTGLWSVPSRLSYTVDTT